RPESEQFFRLTKTAKQAMFVLSSIQPDAGRRKKGRSKPDRILRQAPSTRILIPTPAKVGPSGGLWQWFITLVTSYNLKFVEKAV
ncbi:MAG: hypothetical protein K9N55_10515, partial [Phycisphaerae bacterium]|nr:hypothetical protein [Phycisphaerae bacterium]